MKNLLKISFIAVGLLISLGAQAKEGDFSFEVKRLNEKKIAFFSNQSEVVEFTLTSTDEEVLYNQLVKVVAGATKIYDLGSLMDGTYSFKLETGSKSAVYKVVIAKGEATVSSPVVIEKLKPILTRQNQVITLDMENTPAGAMEVQVLNEYGDVLFTQSFEGGSKYSKKFNIANVEIDALTFVIKSSNQECKEIVQVN